MRAVLALLVVVCFSAFQARSKGNIAVIEGSPVALGIAGCWQEIGNQSDSYSYQGYCSQLSANFSSSRWGQCENSLSFDRKCFLLSDIRRERFIRHVAKKHQLIFIGDSLSLQMADHTACTLNALKVAGKYDVTDLFNHTKDAVIRYISMRISAVHSFLEHNMTHRISNPVTLRPDIAAFLKATNARQIVIFNEGAWWGTVASNDLDYERAATHVAHQTQRMRARFVWRTTFPGHNNCHQLYDPRVSDYGWDNFKRWNSCILTIAAVYGIPVLDLYPVFQERPGAHSTKECLHWCTGRGSVMEVAVALLFDFIYQQFPELRDHA